MRPLLLIGAIILLLFLGKKFFDKSSDVPAPGPGGQGKASGPTLPVDIYVTANNTAEQVVYASGTFIPNEEVEIKPELSGRIIKLTIAEGSFVQKGQLIAKIKDDDILAQIKKVRIEEQLAKQIEARQKKLLDINAISREEYELAANRVYTLNADEELLAVQLGRTELRAPFSGKIGLKNISEGAYITPAINVATLVQINPLKIDFSIPEKYLSSIKIGQTLQFNVDGNTKQYTAKVIAIDPRVDESLRTLRVRAICGNPNFALLPGMFVRIQLSVKSNQSIMIPTDAIVPILDGKQVFVMVNGKATPRQITTGVRTQQSVEVVSGLQVGDSLITSAIMTLKPDMPVKVKTVK